MDVFAQTPVRQTVPHGVWEPYRNLLTSHAKQFQRVTTARKWNRGEWYILLISAECGDCLQALRELDSWAKSGKRCVAVNFQPAEESRKISEKYKLSYPVISVSDKEFIRLGGMILPTLVYARNGRPISAADVALKFPEQK